MSDHGHGHESHGSSSHDSHGGGHSEGIIPEVLSPLRELEPEHLAEGLTTELLMPATEVFTKLPDIFEEFAPGQSGGGHGGGHGGGGHGHGH